ncbi:hypothetical protein [Senegalia massiliensis]|uniref:Uncharacterized protein n=1 Tax=Senegalia massiliensis TaxID=1720316 RepID=A0A845QYN4_9CLOT|nr:hypothetical protein [Senegalia massiliensis]NBI06626.1 hypothetical protein [Senegalia massiliensis]
MNDKIYKNDYYIYHLEQVNWLLEQGLKPQRVGIGKHGDYYALFERNQETEDIINRWKLHRRAIQQGIQE